MAGEKAIYRQQIIEYLANPENTPLVPSRWHEIVGLAGPGSVYHHFTTQAERCEIAAEALAIRRKAYAVQSFAVDQALVDAAADGDMQAAKLYYQRLEGWSEKILQQHDGGIIINAYLGSPPDDEHPNIRANLGNPPTD